MKDLEEDEDEEEVEDEQEGFEVQEADDFPEEREEEGGTFPENS